MTPERAAADDPKRQRLDERIVADGLDLRDFELTSLRSRIGLVSQEPYIFSGSIRENVAMGQPSTTLDEIVGVIRAAGLSDFVDQLPSIGDNPNARAEEIAPYHAPVSATFTL